MTATWRELFYRQRAIEDLSPAARNLEQRDIDRWAATLLQQDWQGTAATLPLLAEVHTWALAAGCHDDDLLRRIKTELARAADFSTATPKLNPSSPCTSASA